METLILQSLLFVFVTARLAISKDVYTSTRRWAVIKWVRSLGLVYEKRLL
jgi:hypothetical protein